MARIIGGIGSSHTPTIGFALDAQQAGRPRVGADLQGLRARPATGWRRRSPTCCSSSTTITSRRSSSTTTRTSRSASATSTRSPMRAAARAGCRRSRDIRRSRGTSRPVSWPTSSICRTSRARGSTTAASRRCRCSGRTRPQWPGAIVPLQVGVLRVSDPVGAPLLQARASRCARRSKAIRRISRSRSSPPAACRTRCTASAAASTTRRGTWSSSTCSRRIPRSSPSITIAEYAERGGFEGAEVIMWLIMRGALSKKVQEAAPDVLPAVDDADRDA